MPTYGQKTNLREMYTADLEQLKRDAERSIDRNVLGSRAGRKADDSWLKQIERELKRRSRK